MNLQVRFYVPNNLVQYCKQHADKMSWLLEVTREFFIVRKSNALSASKNTLQEY